MAAGTYLSAELAHTIATTHPQFAGADATYAAQLMAFGTLTNFVFLTSNLTGFGNAGDQLANLYDQMVADLRAAHPGYNFKVSKTNVHTGTQGYSLFGGCEDASKNEIDCLNAGAVYVLTGEGDVSFFEVYYTLTVTSTNSITIVKKSQGGDGTFSFTSPTAALNTTLTTVGGTASTGPIYLNPGTYKVSEAAGGAFSFADLSCSDPDGGTTVDLSARTATIDLDEGEAITCTYTDANSEQQTSALIHNFIRHRLDALLLGDPEGGRFMRRFPWSLWGGGGGGESGSPFAFAGSLAAGRLGDMPIGDVTFSTSLDRIAGAMAYDRSGPAEGFSGPRLPAMMPGGLDIWTEGHYRGYRNDIGSSGDEGYLGIVYLGADVPITDNILLGGLTEFDWAWERDGSLGSTTQGSGWSAGPYASARLGRNLFLDLRAAWGASSNTISPFGTYTDSFSTSRWLTTAKLTGNWTWGNWRFTPSASLKYGQETQAAYTDSVGASIPSQVVSIGRFSFGPEVAYRIVGGNGALIEPQLALTGVWDFAGSGDIDPLTGATTSTATVYGKVEAALAITGPTGASYRLAGTYDGIGSSGDAYDLALHVSVPIH